MLRAVIACASAAVVAITSSAEAQSTGAKCLAPFAELVGDEVFARRSVSVSKSKPVPPDVRKGEAHLYRTVIRDEGKLGPNFAGHYTIIEIGCGAATSCIAIADAKTGHVYFPPNLRSASSLMRDTGKFDVKRLNYRLSSRLLIVAGEPNEDEHREGMSYYLWDGSQLRLFRYVPTATVCAESAVR